MASHDIARLLSAVYGHGELSSVALSQPLPDILASILNNDESKTNDATGTTEQERSEVLDWVSKAGHAHNDLQQLNTHLLSRTYLVGNRRTAADITVLGALHPWLASASPKERLAVPAVTRHLDLMQHDEDVQKSGLIKLVAVDVDDVPKATRTKAAPASKAAAAPAAKGGAPPEGAPTKKKEKKAAAGGGDGKGADKKAAESADAGPRPSNIDLRVGRIVDIKKHPDADSLYVEQIDLNEPEGPRTVVSGLVNYIPIEEMQNRLLVAVCNLKPANMRGVKSHAMVLCATARDGKTGYGSVQLVEVPEGSQPGDRVFFEGCENEMPLDQLNPKKKIFETIQPGFLVLESNEPAWRDPNDAANVLRIVTAKGKCFSKLVGASLS